MINIWGSKLDWGSDLVESAAFHATWARTATVTHFKSHGIASQVRIVKNEGV